MRSELRERDKRQDSIIVRGLKYQSPESFQSEFISITQSILDKTIVLSDIIPVSNKFVEAKF